jgi:hypothetical protein
MTRRPSVGLVAVGVAFNAATFIFALPVYMQLYRGLPIVDLARLVLGIQVFPTVIGLFVGTLIVRFRPAWLDRYLAAATIIAVLALVRLAQEKIGSEVWELPTWLKVASGALALAGMAWLFARRLFTPSTFASVAPVALVVSTVFVAQMLWNVVAPVTNQPVSRSTRPDSVYIFVFDELGYDVLLKDGRIDAESYPNLAGLAAQGLWFTRATSNYRETCQSIPSLITGRAMAPETCRNFTLLGPEHNLLTELDRHYAVTVYGEFLRDCGRPNAGCRGTPHLVARHPEVGISRLLIPRIIRRGPIEEWLGTYAGPYTWSIWDEFLKDLSTGSSGRAFFVHLLMPHQPFVYQPDGSYHGSSFSSFTGEASHDARTYDNYRKQVGLVDRLVGQVVTRLRETGAYESSTIAITGDHGPRLPDRGVTPYLEGISAETPHIPLIVKSPQVAPRTIEVDYQHVDFAPTLAAVLGLSPAWSVEGTSALTAERPARKKRFTWIDEFVLEGVPARWKRVNGS